MFGSIKRRLSTMSTTSTSSNQQNSNARTPRQPIRNSATIPAVYAPSAGPPPAYSNTTSNDSSYTSKSLAPTPNASQKRRSPSPMPVASTADDPYNFLTSFDTVFLIDDSASMGWGNSWTETSRALENLTPICTAHDTDGVDIYFLNAKDQPHHHNITTAGQVIEIFQTVRPRGGTPTGQRLNGILSPYLKEFERCRKMGREEEVKPLNVIVITDGAPSDDVESVIVATAKKLDKWEAVPWQIGIQFFQVGNEPGAAQHLATLDDEIENIGGGCRDIVDTVPYAAGTSLSAEGILKTLLGAVNKRLDRVKL